MMRFHWVEPVAGLFHLQMNVLKMLLHVFEGEPAGESFGVQRFATMLRRQGITKGVKDSMLVMTSSRYLQRFIS